MTKEQQKAAIEAKAVAFGQKCDPLNQTLEKQADLRLGFLNGAEEVINSPSKYGLQPVNQWVSVKDELPNEDGRYWCYVEELNDLGISHFQWNCCFDLEGKTFSDKLEIFNVTHWQPLPPQPDVEPK